MGFITKKLETGSEPRALLKTRLLWSFLIGLLLLSIDVVLMIVDPVLLIAKYNVRVDYGTYIHEALDKELVGVHVSTYLFNVTNAERFQSGVDTKLRVEEIGPFTYQELRRNEYLEIDLDADVIRYSPRIRTKFLIESSIGRPEDINVTMPNIAMLSMASKVSIYPLIPRLGYNLLTARLKSRPIVHMPASDYMWGYDEPLIRLGNSLLPGWIDFAVMGVLDRLYDKKAKYFFEVSANSADKFAIKTVNGLRGLDAWGYKDADKRTKCNSFTDAYEGINYPPDMTSKKNIRIYRNVLCRLLELDYYGTKESFGARGLEYRVSNRTFTRNNYTECLCDMGICEDGISDLSPCFLGLPLVLSNAYFLHADPKLYERIEGMKPDEDRHGSSFVIEPKIGMALETKFSVQLNLYVGDVSFHPETSPYSGMVIPVAYFQIRQPCLDAEQIHNLKLMYVIGPAVVLATRVILLVISVCLVSYSAFMYCHWPTNRSLLLHTFVGKNTVEVPLMR